MRICKMLFIAGALLSITANASPANIKYTLTLTNGGVMPISPAVAYVKNGATGNSEIGQTASQGLIQLCQTGNAAARADELRMDPAITFVTKTDKPLLPGETRTIEVEVANTHNQSLYFEGMYGKTKDSCATGKISSETLGQLASKSLNVYVGRDTAIQTGAFRSATVPMESYPPACQMAMDAVSCLRDISLPSTMARQIRFQTNLLPSVLTFLEGKFGADEVQSLLVPSAGAVQFQISPK